MRQGKIFGEADGGQTPQGLADHGKTLNSTLSSNKIWRTSIAAEKINIIYIRSHWLLYRGEMNME